MNRREFLKGLLATAAGAATATAVGPIVRTLVDQWYMNSPFILHGDGIRDDTKALQALFDGETVYTEDGRALKREKLTNESFVVQFPPGRFLVTSGLTFGEVKIFG